MRFTRLELIAYGPFTDHVLDLSGGEAGVHLILGNNETGKSASLRALTNFLFGIPDRTSDNFRHAHPELRIGATLCLKNGEVITCIRRKGRLNTLLGADNRPLAEDLLLPFIGGIDRRLFETLYGIDQAALVKGGEDLVAGRGDIGESLFAAGTGIRGLRQVQEALAAEAGSLFLSRGKKPINQLIAAFRDLQRQCREKSLAATQWHQHARNLKTSTAELADVKAKLVRASSERNRLERLQSAIPLIVTLRRLGTELKALGEVVPLPADASERRRSAQEILTQAGSRKAGLAQKLARSEEQIASLSFSRDIIRAQEAITRLFQRSGDYITTELDLPQRRGDRYRLLEEAEEILKKLGPRFTLDAVETLRLSAPQAARIQELGRRCVPLKNQLESAGRHIALLTADIEALEGDIARQPPLRDVGPLENACRRARKEGDIEAQIESAAAEAALRRASAAARLESLGLWQGTLEAAERLAVPAIETVQRFETDLAEVDGRLQSTAREMGDCRKRMETIAHSIEMLESSGQVPREADLAAARSHRDQGWRLVRRAWLEGAEDAAGRREFAARQPEPESDQALAAAYAEGVRTADTIADLLRTESDRVAQLAGYQAQKEEAEKRHGELERLQADGQRSLQGLSEKWHRCWRPLGIDPLTPKEMGAWLLKHRQVCESVNELRLREAEAQRLRKAAAAHRKDIGEALADLGHPPSGAGERLENLIDRAEGVAAAGRTACHRLEGLQKDLAAARRRLAQTVEEKTQAASALESWQASWTEAIRPLGLDHNALPEEVDAVLGRTQELFRRLDKAHDTLGRIRAMETKSKRFSEAAADLCSRLAPDLAVLSPDEAVSGLNERLTAAVKSEASLARLKETRLDLLESIRSEQAGADAAAAALAQMCAAAGADRIEALPRIEQQAADARRLRERIDRIEEELTRHSGGMALEAFLQVADSVDVDTLPATLAGLEEEIARIEARRSELEAAIALENDRLRRMDGSGEAAELAEQAQATLAELRDRAEEFARLRLAALLLQRQIERYREANQGPILKRAGEIFRRLTSESFCRVAPDYDEKDTPVLVGVRPSGEKVGLDGMSDGTCDQLYLALRLASIEQRLIDAEPIPVVLDDILVNFDDRRSRAALEVLAEISAKTQVIFFTHHRHLVEIAESCLGSGVLFLHRL